MEIGVRINDRERSVKIHPLDMKSVACKWSRNLPSVVSFMEMFFKQVITKDWYTIIVWKINI